jgi:AcrR family transcriptional regulator
LPKIVDYDARRREIAAQAVSVFVKDGLGDANLSKIAELCGFGRTTIYKYFKNKEEIFLFALDEIFGRVQREMDAISADSSLGAADKLTSLLEVFVRASMEDKERMILVMDLILDRNSEGLEVATRERVMRLRGVFEQILEEGTASGQLKQVKPAPMAFALYSLVEAYVIQNSLFSGYSYTEAMEATRVLIDGLRAPGH